MQITYIILTEKQRDKDADYRHCPDKNTDRQQCRLQITLTEKQTERPRCRLQVTLTEKKRRDKDADYRHYTLTKKQAKTRIEDREFLFNSFFFLSSKIIIGTNLTKRTANCSCGVTFTDVASTLQGLL